MTERELKLLLEAQALKQVQIHFAVMSQGYMIVADGNPLESGKRNTAIQDTRCSGKVIIQAGDC